MSNILFLLRSLRGRKNIIFLLLHTQLSIGITLNTQTSLSPFQAKFKQGKNLKSDEIWFKFNYSVPSKAKLIFEKPL